MPSHQANDLKASDFTRHFRSPSPQALRVAAAAGHKTGRARPRRAPHVQQQQQDHNILYAMLKLKSRFAATRFDFQLHVHSLQPWPDGNKGVAIGWQRGKHRRGATGSVVPLPCQDGSGGTVVRFNERINFKSTLYKVRGWGVGGGRRDGG